MAKEKLIDDVTVQSVLDCRRAYHEMTDKEFARWYEHRYKVPDKRVLAILKRQEDAKCTSSP